MGGAPRNPAPRNPLDTGNVQWILSGIFQRNLTFVISGV